MARVSRRKANSKNTNRNSVRRNNNRNNRNMGNKSKRRNNNKRSKNKRSRSKGSRRRRSRRQSQRGGDDNPPVKVNIWCDDDNDTIGVWEGFESTTFKELKATNPRCPKPCGEGDVCLDICPGEPPDPVHGPVTCGDVCEKCGYRGDYGITSLSTTVGNGCRCTEIGTGYQAEDVSTQAV